MINHKCEVCSKEAKYRQFSPDSYPYFYCSIKHYKEYIREHLYRSLPIENLKTGKYVEKYDWTKRIIK